MLSSLEFISVSKSKAIFGSKLSNVDIFKGTHILPEMINNIQNIYETYPCLDEHKTDSLKDGLAGC